LEGSLQPVLARDGSSWRAKIHDISQGGVGLALNRRFEPGTLLVIELEKPTQNVTRTVIGRVVHATPSQGNDWLVGCAFSGTLDDDDLRLFRAERTPAEGDDARAWLRYTCEVETTCAMVDDPEEKSWVVKVVNISAGGVGLLAPLPVDAGTRLKIELPATPGEAARPALVRVVKPGQWDGRGWLLGCEFADPLWEEELEELRG
jgi:hypothetical protein